MTEQELIHLPHNISDSLTAVAIDIMGEYDMTGEQDILMRISIATVFLADVLTSVRQNVDVHVTLDSIVATIRKVLDSELN